MKIKIPSKKLKILQDISSRLTGFSIPIFGMSWQPSDSELKIAKELIVFLEDKRVLYSPYEFEVPAYCTRSIMEIRAFLTQQISKISQEQELYNDIQLLRAACRKFLNDIHPYERDLDGGTFRNSFAIANFFTALGVLRGVFGIYISKISISYGVIINDDLMQIIPSKVDASYK
jgi:hypothetical protein